MVPVGALTEGAEKLLIWPKISPLVTPLGLGTYLIFRILLLIGGSHFWNGEQFKPMVFQLSWSYLLCVKKQTNPTKTNYLLQVLLRADPTLIQVEGSPHVCF